MGKAKKGKRLGRDEELDEEVEVTQTTTVEEKTKGKDKNKKVKEEPKEEEAEEEAAKPKGKKKKGKKSAALSDEEETAAGSENEAPKPVTTTKSGGGFFEFEELPDEDEEEEIVPKKKKGKKNKGADKAVEEEKTDDLLDEFEGGGTVKTAAQKKKDKKEREKQKKAAQRAEGRPEQPKAEQEEVNRDPPNVEPPKPEPKPQKENKGKQSKKQVESDDSADENERESKKKPQKKTKEVSEKASKPDKKGPGKKTLSAMQEALRILKEQKEREEREEAERIRKEEEEEAARLEALRIEQEKKALKKQREKERKERLKAEGKLLTPKQRADRARAQAMLDALKAQGVDLPNVGEKKAPRSGTRIRPHKMKQQISTETIEDESLKKEEPSETVHVEIVDQGEKEAPAPEENVKDSWDADSSDEDKSEDRKKVDGAPKKTAEQKPTEPEESSDSSSEEESDSDDSGSSDDDGKTDAVIKRERALARIQKRREEAEKKKSTDDLRAAVICVLGHVDTGKTKILDKLRKTNVQDGEAGGITQQIGATNVPIDAIKEETKFVKGFADKELKLPGLLIIDTPGHESFSNLRSRGSSLCDMAILVVDIMHALEPQTIESLNLLKTRKTPFVVALNKIDRLYDWETMSKTDVRDIIKAQAANTQLEFEQRTKEVILQFAEQGLNAALFYENPDPRTYVSLVPTSAITGEGMGNLLALIVESCQTLLAKRLMYSEELQATVLEVKAIPGFGTTIDAIVVNGRLREGDTMIVAGTDGPIVTQIRSLVMPQPMKELRVKNAYVEHKEVKAAQGVKIAAKELEKAIAGLNIQVAQKPDEIEILKEEVAKELKNALSHVRLSERGVYVQASTLGSLEALLEFLRTSKIPYANIRIGPVVRRDVMIASTMLEHDSQYATILAFDVKAERDAQELADAMGVKIFQADIIYHLFDKFMAYREELRQRKRDEFRSIAVFPCKLKILPQYIFNSRDPIICGVIVEAGIVKEGTPICVPTKDFVDLGVVTSVEINHKAVENARKGMEVCIKIEPIPGESPKMFGRHFDETDMLVSKISRQSIDACKDYFRDDLTKQDWQLMVELKKVFEILYVPGWSGR